MSEFDSEERDTEPAEQNNDDLEDPDREEGEGEQANRIAAVLEEIHLARESGSDSENDNVSSDHNSSTSSASSEPSSEDGGDDDAYDYLR